MRVYYHRSNSRYPKDTVLKSSVERTILRKDLSSVRLQLGNTIQIPDIKRIVILDTEDSVFHIRTFLEYAGKIFPIYTKSVTNDTNSVVLSITSGISEFLQECGYNRIHNLRDQMRDTLMSEIVELGGDIPAPVEQPYGSLDNEGSSIREFTDDTILRSEILDKNIELCAELEDLDMEYRGIVGLPECSRPITDDVLMENLDSFTPEDLFTSAVYRYMSDIIDSGEVDMMATLESLSMPSLPEGFIVDTCTKFSADNPRYVNTDFAKLYGVKGVLHPIPKDNIVPVKHFTPELISCIQNLHKLPIFELVFEYILSSGRIVVHDGTCPNCSFDPVVVLKKMSFDLDTIVNEVAEEPPEKVFFKFNKQEEMFVVTVRNGKITKFYIDLIVMATLSLGLARRIHK